MKLVYFAKVKGEINEIAEIDGSGLKIVDAALFALKGKSHFYTL